MAKVGRPTKLTLETQQRIVDAIRVGATYQLASQYGGITYNTFLAWMKKGESAKSGDYFEFFDAIKEAENNAMMEWLILINKAARDGSWQAAAWKLERRYPEMYGRTRHEVTGADGNELVIKVVRDRKSDLPTENE